MASEADKKKVILAVSLLVVAGLVVLWNFGVFSGGGKTEQAKQPEAPTSAADAKAKGVKPRPGARSNE